jgi:hypothetical protein
MTMKSGSDTDGAGKFQGKGKEKKKGYDAPFVGYVNLQLTDEQKEAYVSWAASESFWEQLEYQVGDGVNLSIKVDVKSGGFIGSATQRREDSPNAGLVVTARGGSVTKALGRTLYCLTILSHKEQWVDTQPLANPDRW